MFGLRMAKITSDASYFDTVERALYNTVRAGISLEGDRYFYVNPLEVWPETCIEKSSRSHIKPVRQKWFDCACCPTNVARTFTGLGNYIYTVNNSDIFINLFIQNQVSFEIDGKPVNLSLETDFPKTGNVKIRVKADNVHFTLYIRIPFYADDFSVMINRVPAKEEKRKGYFCIEKTWNEDEIAVFFSMKPRFIYANAKVHHNCGKTAIARGPEIYCLEECDNGTNLAALSLDTGQLPEEYWREDILGGIMQIKAKGKRLIEPVEPVSFSEKFTPRTEDTELNFIPYGLWANRSPGEMLVWVRECK